jgi:hypothetical protein
MRKTGVHAQPYNPLFGIRKPCDDRRPAHTPRGRMAPTAATAENQSMAFRPSYGFSGCLSGCLARCSGNSHRVRDCSRIRDSRSDIRKCISVRPVSALPAYVLGYTRKVALLVVHKPLPPLRISEGIEAMRKSPNKPSLPIRPSVTPRACARVAPASLMAGW